MPGRNKIGQTIGLAVGEKDRTDASSESGSLCHGDIIFDSKTVQIKLRTVNIPQSPFSMLFVFVKKKGGDLIRDL
jgi:hypothetical protein